ncbi:MAG: 5'/3'-nucleotidase SurE, partial [Vallitaleaceae bacterium]|nr:5'/3'-nucleotidase SurE [Vallitaleaceae bacterium]
MKPLILVTNDDGIYSPGLWAVVEVLMDLGELLVVAPIEQQTGMGRSFPKNEETGIIEKMSRVVNGQVIEAYGVHGSPAYAVSHGVLELCDRKPDLCVSGINYGENLGLSLTCSGTLGAAFEADSHGIFSIAVSRQADLSIQHSNDFREMDWEASKSITREIVSEVLRNGYPGGVSILNINVPDGATSTTEKRMTKQSRLNYSVFQKPQKRDFSKGYLLKSKLDVDIDKTEK